MFEEVTYENFHGVKQMRQCFLIFGYGIQFSVVSNFHKAIPFSNSLASFLPLTINLQINRADETQYKVHFLLYQKKIYIEHLTSLWQNLPLYEIYYVLGFPGGSVVKNPPWNTGDIGSLPGPGRSHMSQSNSACAPLPSLCPGACKPPLLRSAHLKPILHGKRTHDNEKSGP